jgi:hypothetical protein
MVSRRPYIIFKDAAERWQVLAQSKAPASRVALAVADAPPLVCVLRRARGVFMHLFGRELASVFHHVTKHRGERLWAFPGG